MKNSIKDEKSQWEKALELYKKGHYSKQEWIDFNQKYNAEQIAESLFSIMVNKEERGELYG